MRILLIEDANHVATVMARRLQPYGDVDMAQTSGAALDYLRRNDYDWVVSDLSLPDTDDAKSWISDLDRAATGASKIIYSSNDTSDVVDFAKGKSFQFVHKRDAEEVEAIIAGRPLTKARQPMQNDDFRRSLVRLGLWNYSKEQPDWETLEDVIAFGKAAAVRAKKLQSAKEKAGMALFVTIAIAIATGLWQLFLIGAQSSLLKAAAAKALILARLS